MRVREARPDDSPRIARLWHECFPGRRTVEDRTRMLETGGRYGGLETVRVAVSGDELVGAAKLYSMTEHVTGTALPMMGLAAVAVAPAFRRRGIAASLCREAVAGAAERGDAISVLYPFRPDYYERLGWGLVGRLVEHRFAPSQLPRCDEAGAVRPARLPADAHGIQHCYSRVASRGHGPIERDDRVWAYRFTGQELGVKPVEEGAPYETDDPRQAALVFDDGGGIDGYALLRHVRLDDPDRRTVVVRELVAATPAAYRGLLGALAERFGAWPRAVHYARPEERFADRLRDPRPPGFSNARSLWFPTGRIVRGPMLRIVDVPSALVGRRWFDAPPGAGASTAGEAVFAVIVQDGLRPENTGEWRVTVRAGGRAEVERLDPGAAGGVAGRSRAGGAPAASIEADISTLGRIWAGELPPAAAVRLGRAAIEGDAALLDAAFAVRESFWLLDEF